jgi:hypothetical protein
MKIGNEIVYFKINISIFHHSIIPSGLHGTCSMKNSVISIHCRNSETLQYSIDASANSVNKYRV